MADQTFDPEQIVRLWNLPLDAIMPVELTEEERDLFVRGLIE